VAHVERNNSGRGARHFRRIAVQWGIPRQVGSGASPYGPPYEPGSPARRQGLERSMGGRGATYNRHP